MEMPVIKIAKLSTSKSLIDFSLLAFQDTYKIRAEIREYGQNGRGTSAAAQAYMDPGEAALIFHDILYMQFKRTWPTSQKGLPGYAVYGGSKRNGEVRARQLIITYSQESGKFSFTAREGPGKVNAQGGIQLSQAETQAVTYQPLQNVRGMAKKMVDFVAALNVFELYNGSYGLWETFVPQKGGALVEQN